MLTMERKKNQKKKALMERTQKNTKLWIKKVREKMRENKNF